MDSPSTSPEPACVKGTSWLVLATRTSNGGPHPQITLPQAGEGRNSGGLRSSKDQRPKTKDQRPKTKDPNQRN